MPIEPVDPSKKTGGDGNEKYAPEEKRGPSKFDEALERAERAREEVKKMSEKTRSEPPYQGKAYSDTGPKVGPKTSGGFGGGGGGAGIPKVGPKKPMDMKKGGKVKSASARADGIAIRGKTRAQYGQR